LSLPRRLLFGKPGVVIVDARAFGFALGVGHGSAKVI